MQRKKYEIKKIKKNTNGLILLLTQDKRFKGSGNFSRFLGLISQPHRASDLSLRVKLGRH